MIIFSAPSGAGKTTIVKEILKNQEFNFEFSISACSRPKRVNETDGVDYYFMSADDFKKKIENNEFIEWEQVYENQYYGTLNSEVERIWQKGKNVVFDVDVVGGMNIKNQFSEKALSVFIKPPSIEVLKNRLINRKTETEATLKKRIDKAEWEMQFAEKFDLIVVNDNLEIAVDEVKNNVKNFLQL
mgnify:CR=1 FL=1